MMKPKVLDDRFGVTKEEGSSRQQVVLPFSSILASIIF